ncbi:hypothetical protein WBP06_12940 [Novosphingobium sp. BL-8H]|uniref:hypothetical protein n=1 Tax=Novosphingobium sp. BL-8H TaxID=3127640 RepID=UPI003756F631
MIRKIMIAVAALVGGTAIGGGAAFAVVHFAPHMLPGIPKQREASEFVATGTILAPVTFADGRLSGYVSFECQLEVPQGKGAEVTQQLPVLLNAVNMRSYRQPLASGPDGMIPNLELFRRLMMDAAREVYGPDIVRRAVITQAAPI